MIHQVLELEEYTSLLSAYNTTVNRVPKNLKYLTSPYKW